MADAARQIVAAHAVGLGPRNSLIVGGSDVLFAVAGLIQPRIVVSAGALASLDDDELAAGFDHEAGHIARRHRFVMLLALGLRALGRAVPGSGRASASSRSTSSATRTVGRCGGRTTASRWRA
jgi:Zn-dependent protease with chaperone function